MSLELFNSLATFGTFLVIAATAIAALVQLRHARGANLIEAYGELQEIFQSSSFREAQHFVLTELAAKWKDPAFRYQVEHLEHRTPENQVLIGKMNVVGNFWEQTGLMIKRGLVDRQIALEMYSGNVQSAWPALAPVTVAFRRTNGQALWENFEYFEVLAEDWVAAHPNGAYPKNVRRLHIEDTFKDADDVYAASLSV